MDWIKAYALAKRNGGGGSGGLPEGATAYQQLVTDGDGNTKWEDRTHYKHTRIAIAVNPENDPWSDITSCYMGGTRSNDPVQVNQGKAIYTEVWENYSSGLGKNWVFYWDGVKYETQQKRLPAKLSPGTSDWPFGYYITRNDMIVYYTDENSHTFEWEVINPELKQLSEEYIPTTIPRVETASVGQLVVVKSVDENGKPTEWETVNTNDFWILTDDATGIKYRVHVSNGELTMSPLEVSE